MPPAANHVDFPAATPAALGGLRLTRQRREVYEALLHAADHPSAVQVFARVRQRVPSISLATVYNCLETLAKSGLVRQVTLDRGAARFCANRRQHGHFFCTHCGRVQDVDLPDAGKLARLWRLPEGATVEHYECSLRGLCPTCAAATAEISQTD
ncbi:MAG: transcriptional repressor [Verrucomicrobia bacterium]|nr:transcriptional repressor [Verrucomicrobiota bacterium]MBV9658896.1 transcriptional repressor [Verrucomicrobiota bacterium]